MFELLFKTHVLVIVYLISYINLFHFVHSDKWSSHFANISVLASENAVAIVGLLPITSYQVRMFAFNNLGRSESSDVITIQTAEETPGGPPLHIKAVALSSTSIKVGLFICKPHKFIQ